MLHPKLEPTPKPPPKPLTLADLPPACKTVLDAPANPQRRPATLSDRALIDFAEFPARVIALD